MQVKIYKNAYKFLLDWEGLLMTDELNNNLMLGLCLALKNDIEPNPQHHFIGIWKDKTPIVASISTINHAILFQVQLNTEAIILLVNYYKEREVPLSGCFGESLLASSFQEAYLAKIETKQDMLSHQLDSLESIVLPAGKMEVASQEDLLLMTQWMIDFQKEAQAPPFRSEEALKKSTQNYIDKAVLYKWVVNGIPVSCAANHRNTPNNGIIGFVYTPSKFRGQGFATAVVWKLSEHILLQGYQACGLFTDIANPKSNKIYKKIGYQRKATFSGISFHLP